MAVIIINIAIVYFKSSTLLTSKANFAKDSFFSSPPIKQRIDHMFLT